MQVEHFLYMELGRYKFPRHAHLTGRQNVIRHRNLAVRRAATAYLLARENPVRRYRRPEKVSGDVVGTGGMPYWVWKGVPSTEMVGGYHYLDSSDTRYPKVYANAIRVFRIVLRTIPIEDTPQLGDVVPVVDSDTVPKGLLKVRMSYQEWAEARVSRKGTKTCRRW